MTDDDAADPVYYRGWDEGYAAGYSAAERRPASHITDWDAAGCVIAAAIALGVSLGLLVPALLELLA